MDSKENHAFLSEDSDGTTADISPSTGIFSWKLLFPLKMWKDRSKTCKCLQSFKTCHREDDGQEVSPLEAFALADSGDTEGLDRFLNCYPEFINVNDENDKTLMHHAAERGHAQTIDFLCGKGCTGIHSPDHEGNTPLHLAAMNDMVPAVKTLIGIWRSAGDGRRGFCVKNVSLETPMHLAARKGSAGSLECLLSVCNGGVSTPGWHGETPLHVAACMNNVEAAKILIKYGADPLKTSFSGMKPVHNAARKASVDILRYFLSGCGTPKDTLLALVDDEVQTPLHWAVNNGDLSTVEILMQFGAKLSAKMYDQSTPLHLACSQGLICVVTKMFEIVPDEFIDIMGTKDSQGMTCLHRATMFNHVCCVQFLLEKGAEINDEDNEGRSPLILAASRASWDCQAILLRSGADATISDHCGRNFLHYVIAHGNSPEMCKDTWVYLQNASQLLDQSDNLGCTPLHYAAQNGSLRSSAGLVKLGASICIKDKQSQSPLHFAARYGRYNTVKRLLETHTGFNLINDADKNCMTALHLAAENGHSRIVQLLMSKGALIHRDCAGRTPLHLAAAQNYRETVDMIFVHYAHLMDSVDKEGNTALHLAATNNASASVTYLLSAGAAMIVNNNKQLPIDIVIQRKHNETARAMVAHERWEEILTQSSAIYVSPVLGLIEHLPEIMSTGMDRCVVRAPCHPLSKDYFIHFCFKLLEPVNKSKTIATEHHTMDINEPLIVLNGMVRHGRCELLSHPVCSSYLNKKWASYGVYFHGMHVAVYAIFLAFLTYLVCSGVESNLIPILKDQSYGNVKKYAAEEAMLDMNDTSSYHEEQWIHSHPLHGKCYVFAVLVVTCFTVINIFKEFVQMIHQKQRYFKDLVNYLEWALYITTTIFALAHFDQTGSIISWKARWQLGACAIFLAWFNFMLYLQRFGMIGIYVVMFFCILKTLLRALFAFIFLIIAFGLAFHVLLPMTVYPDNPEFYEQPNLRLDVLNLRTPHLGLLSSSLRITGMMLGDLDTIDNYIYPITNQTLPFPQMTYIFLVMFIITVSILLMNLLIGLAVGDIENIQRNAMLRRIGMQVELHTILERKFPKWFHRWVTTNEDRYYPNRSAGLLRRIWFITTDPAKAMKDQATDVGHPLYPTRMNNEMQKQQSRMKELQRKIDQQHDLLRLIVQKMEINDEADELDEGVQSKKGNKYGGNINMSAVKRAKWVAGSIQAKTKAVAAFSTRHSISKPK